MALMSPLACVQPEPDLPKDCSNTETLARLKWEGLSHPPMAAGPCLDWLPKAGKQVQQMELQSSILYPTWCRCRGLALAS